MLLHFLGFATRLEFRETSHSLRVVAKLKVRDLFWKEGLETAKSGLRSPLSFSVSSVTLQKTLLALAQFTLETFCLRLSSSTVLEHFLCRMSYFTFFSK